MMTYRTGADAEHLSTGLLWLASRFPLERIERFPHDAKLAALDVATAFRQQTAILDHPIDGLAGDAKGLGCLCDAHSVLPFHAVKCTTLVIPNARTYGTLDVGTFARPYEWTVLG